MSMSSETKSRGGLGIMASIILMIGIVIGLSVDNLYDERLNERQVDFVDGVVAGVSYKSDFDTWSSTPGHSTYDTRSDPDKRCVAAFYPERKDALLGCFQAINGRPAEGYNFPK